MSQVYSTEPATTGHVVFETSHGPIDINLFCKECPTTTRTFLQLCLDGYYDGMIFHRILSDFLIQTGLTRHSSLAASASADSIDKYLRGSTAVSSKSSSMSGADALGWDRKRLEVNPRIRFNHRGQIAVALPLEENSSADTSNDNAEETLLLRYQFFVTLDEAPFLDAKHVVFGTVAGSTMFNALRIGRTDADEQTGIPTDLEDSPPRIKNVKIDYHPFDDLVVTAEKKIPWKINTADGDNRGTGGGNNGKQSTMEKKRKKRKGKRDFNVLSFGDEERDYDAIATIAKSSLSMKSSHDTMSGKSKFFPPKVDVDVETRSKIKDCEESVLTSKITSKNSSRQKDDEEAIDEHYDKEPEGKLTQMHTAESMTLNEFTLKEQDEKYDETVSKEEERPTKHRKSSKSKRIAGVEARRSKYVKSGTGHTSTKKERLRREGDTMTKLLAFKTKVLETKGSKINVKVDKQQSSNDDSLAARMAERIKQDDDARERRSKEQEAFMSVPGYSGKVDDETDTGDWMCTKFKFKQHADNESRHLDKIGKSQDKLGGDGRRMDDYVVFDEKHRSRDKNGHHKRYLHRR